MCDTKYWEYSFDKGNWNDKPLISYTHFEDTINFRQCDEANAACVFCLGNGTILKGKSRAGGIKRDR